MPRSVSSPSGRRIGSGLFASRCWRVDSNHRPTDYESVALPAELRQPASRAQKGERALYQRQNRGQTTIFLAAKPQDPAAENGGLSPVLLGLRSRANDDVHAVG